MTNATLHTVLRQLRGVVLCQDTSALTDAQLLNRFVQLADETAFEALVRRHRMTVWGVCRRILRHQQNAEDAFQATFLVLVRKAHSIAKREALGSWLHKVAYRIALEAKKSTPRLVLNHARIADFASRPESEEPHWREIRPILDEEVNRLPAKYRVPFVLCYLDGKSNVEAARLLGWPKGTLLTRLSWARRRLRIRLTSRGIAPAAAFAGVLAGSRTATSAIPAVFISKTVRLVLGAANGNLAGPTVSANVDALTNRVIQAMLITRLKIAAVALFTFGFISLGAGVVTQTLVAREVNGAFTLEQKKRLFTGPAVDRFETAMPAPAWKESSLLPLTGAADRTITIQIDEKNICAAYKNHSFLMPSGVDESTRQSLQTRLKELAQLESAGINRVVIQCDPEVKYSIVRAVLETCKAAGLQTIEMTTEHE